MNFKLILIILGISTVFQCKAQDTLSDVPFGVITVRKSPNSYARVRDFSRFYDGCDVRFIGGPIYWYPQNSGICCGGVISEWNYYFISLGYEFQNAYGMNTIGIGVINQPGFFEDRSILNTWSLNFSTDYKKTYGMAVTFEKILYRWNISVNKQYNILFAGLSFAAFRQTEKNLSYIVRPKLGISPPLGWLNNFQFNYGYDVYLNNPETEKHRNYFSAVFKIPFSR